MAISNQGIGIEGKKSSLITFGTESLVKLVVLAPACERWRGFGAIQQQAKNVVCDKHSDMSRIDR